MAPHKKPVAIFGKFSREFGECVAAVKKTKTLAVVTTKPDAVISYGGDGTLLKSERRYPGVPKLAIRKAKDYGVKRTTSLDRVLDEFGNDALIPVKYDKLKCAVKRNSKVIARFEALNEITIRNKNLGCALRYSLQINNEYQDRNRSTNSRDHQIIGDGVIVATPFGSTGYFSSLTRKNFTKGIGIAHNNPTTAIRPCVVSRPASIMIRIIREKGEMCADNCKGSTIVVPGDSVSIRISSRPAQILQKEGSRGRGNVFHFV